MSPQLLTTFLETLSSTFRDKISNALLIPLVAASATLVFIHGETQGWQWYTDLWDKAGAVERTLLIAAVAFGFLFVAAALDGLTAQLDRQFASGIPRIRQEQEKTWQAEWQRARDRERRWVRMYQRFSDLRKASAEPTADAPDAGPPPSEWVTGMQRLLLNLPETHLPATLAAGDIVTVHARGGRADLVPGGVQVLAATETNDTAAVDGRAVRLRSVTLAVPPAAIAPIAAVPNVDLLLSPRPAPTRVPFWEPHSGWTRRAIAARPSARDRLEPGDLLKLKGNRSHAIDATFCEQAGAQWIVAMRERDLPGGELPSWLRQGRFTWERATVPVPIASAAIREWTLVPVPARAIPLRNEVVRRGRVRIGDVTYASGEVILDRTELRGRYARADIPAGVPFTHAALNTESRSLAFLRPNPTRLTPALGDYCHVLLHPTEQPTEPPLAKHVVPPPAPDEPAAPDSERPAATDALQVRLFCRWLENGVVAIPADPGEAAGLTVLHTISREAFAKADIPDPEPGSWEQAQVLELAVSNPDALKGIRVIVLRPQRREAYSAQPEPIAARRVTSPKTPPPDDCAETIVTCLRIPPPQAAEPPDRDFEPEDGALQAKTATIEVVADTRCARSCSRVTMDSDYLTWIDGDIDAFLSSAGPDGAPVHATAILDRFAAAQAHQAIDPAHLPSRACTRAIITRGAEIESTLLSFVDRTRDAWTLFFPRDKVDVAATRYGNILQTIPSYAHETYGMHSPTLLPRLLGMLNEAARAPYVEARARIDLLLWSVVASIVTGTVGLWLLWPFFDGMWLPEAAFAFVTLVALPYALTQALTSAALRLADSAKFLLDTQRGLILRRMGIEAPKVFENAKDPYTSERALWEHVAQRIEYGHDDHPNLKPVTYRLPPADSEQEGVS